MRKLTVVISLVIIALFVAWYALRPERLIVNKRVDETAPAATAGSLEALASGSFHSIAHETKGTATVYRAANGGRILRFSNFSTSNGPDVHVYMVAADNAYDAATVEHAGFIDLGNIKGNIGDQDYTLGRDVDLSKYRAVSVWCKRFSVNFGTAPLNTIETKSGE
jgi:Electron transfer DM13